MKTSMQMVQEYRAFIDYVEYLKAIDEVYWEQPISEGKWSLKDIICHMALWDKYFYEEGIEKVKLGAPVTVRHLDFNEFNANAREHAKLHNKDSIIDLFLLYRNKIIDAISDLPEEEYIKEYIDGDKKKFTIRGYLRGFIPHDKHHKKQIEKYLKPLSS